MWPRQSTFYLPPAAHSPQLEQESTKNYKGNYWQRRKKRWPSTRSVIHHSLSSNLYNLNCKLQKASNPFAAAQQQPEEPAAAASSDPPNILDLFGMSGGGGGNPTPGGVAAEPNKASDDLLQLSGANPFASVLNSNANNSTTAPAAAANSSSNFGGTAFPESNANGQYILYNFYFIARNFIY